MKRKLNTTNLTIATLLSFMESETVVAIRLNHMVIEDRLGDIPSTNPNFETLPSFTVEYAGFVEIELHLDTTHQNVVRLSLRQAAMTFEQLEESGELLPSLTIACEVLNTDERNRLNTLAAKFVEQGKVKDKNQAEALITQYADKVIFCPRKYGGPSHV